MRWSPRARPFPTVRWCWAHRARWCARSPPTRWRSFAPSPRTTSRTRAATSWSSPRRRAKAGWLGNRANPRRRSAASKAHMNASPARLALTLTVLAALAGAPAGAVELQQETRAVAGFHRIDINGEARVTLVQGATESVTIEAAAAALPQIHTGVHG